LAPWIPALKTLPACSWCRGRRRSYHASISRPAPM
jgi:hypothetical protein